MISKQNQSSETTELVLLILKWIFSIFAAMILLFSLLTLKIGSVLAYLLILILISPLLTPFWRRVIKLNKILKFFILFVIALIGFPYSNFKDFKTIIKSKVENEVQVPVQVEAKSETQNETTDSVVKYDAATGERLGVEAAPMETKEELVERITKEQFNPWDESHRKLEELIKDNMNDPDSYKHVRTDWWLFEDHIVVKTIYRGKNAFGGVVTNSIRAKFDFNGNLIDVLK